MTNTHRKTTTRTTAKIAAVSAFGIGAAIAFPGIAAAQDATTPESPTASLENLADEDGSLSDLTGEDGSLEGALDTELAVDLGSLTFNLNLGAETPNPGSVELGSLGVSPNTGSALIDGDLGSGSGSAEDDGTTETENAGPLGSLTGSADDDTATGETEAETAAATGSASSGTDEATEGTDETDTPGSLDIGSLAGLSSGADDGAETDGTVETEQTGTTGSLA